MHPETCLSSSPPCNAAHAAVSGTNQTSGSDIHVFHADLWLQPQCKEAKIAAITSGHVSHIRYRDQDLMSIGLLIGDEDGEHTGCFGRGVSFVSVMN